MQPCKQIQDRLARCVALISCFLHVGLPLCPSNRAAAVSSTTFTSASTVQRKTRQAQCDYDLAQTRCSFDFSCLLCLTVCSVSVRRLRHRFHAGVSILTDRPGHVPATCSGNQQSRVAINYLINSSMLATSETCRSVAQTTGACSCLEHCAASRRVTAPIRKHNTAM